MTRIKDFYGKTIGFLENKPDGRVVAYDFYRRKVGEYSPHSDTTRDFYGRIYARGNQAAMLIADAAARNNSK